MSFIKSKWGASKFEEKLNNETANTNMDITATPVGMLNKVIKIGTWIMFLIGTANVIHGLTMNKIRSVTVLIINDAGDVIYDLTHAATDGHAEGKVIINPATIGLSRRDPGLFTDAAYSLPGNRGWVTIWYEA